jgi:hypothetical protein
VSVVTSGLGVPLSVLDLCPVPTGESAAEALRRSVGLARHAEQRGYRCVGDELLAEPEIATAFCRQPDTSRTRSFPLSSTRMLLP